MQCTSQADVAVEQQRSDLAKARDRAEVLEQELGHARQKSAGGSQSNHVLFRLVSKPIRRHASGKQTVFLGSIY